MNFLYNVISFLIRVNCTDYNFFSFDVFVFTFVLQIASSSMETELKEIGKITDHWVKETKEVLQSEKDEASRVMKDFGSYTTLHGFHFIFDSGSLIRRIIWVTLILLGICFLFFQFRDNYRKYNSNLSIISKDTEHHEKLLFPAITFCNQNMMRRSKILGTDAQTFLDQQDHLKLNVLGKSLLEKETDPSFKIDESVKNNSHVLSEMLKSCVWMNQPCTSANFTSFLSFLVRLYALSGRIQWKNEHDDDNDNDDGDNDKDRMIMMTMTM